VSVVAPWYAPQQREAEKTGKVVCAVDMNAGAGIVVALAAAAVAALGVAAAAGVVVKAVERGLEQTGGPADVAVGHAQKRDN